MSAARIASMTRRRREEAELELSAAAPSAAGLEVCETTPLGITASDVTSTPHAPRAEQIRALT